MKLFPWVSKDQSGNPGLAFCTVRYIYLFGFFFFGIFFVHKKLKKEFFFRHALEVYLPLSILYESMNKKSNILGELMNIQNWFRNPSF